MHEWKFVVQAIYMVSALIFIFVSLCLCFSYFRCFPYFHCCSFEFPLLYLIVKVSHIAKRSLSCRLYKPWTLFLSQGVFWEWVRPMDFYMVSEPGSFDNYGSFSPVVEHVFGQRCHTWWGVLKCPTLLRDPCLVDFISHGHPFSLKASFESE